ncbi:MAG: DUF1573 domain-containing protein, partial [Prevotellaceae bacterium]|jgi:hypothetical protein|nr:DUF1573 domain-containing protein [Prevotellaceae bacterium]
MKKIFIAAAICLMNIGAWAQMQFTKTAHDFGQIPEMGGDATYQFEFTNTGKAPIIITNVESSCGCTTPEWSKQPVLPGKTGFVKAIFDPKDRPGIFDKEITVSTTTEQVTLKISGEVLPKTKGIADLYPRVIGQLRLKSLNIPFANIYNTATAVDSLPVVNTGSTAVSITFENVPPHLALRARPQTLAPNEKGSIICTYNAAGKNDWGYVTDKVALTLNGASSKGDALAISASIDEDFSGLKGDQLANAPVARFAQRSVDLGSVAGSAGKEFSISIANDGKSDLLLRKISSSCDCITLSDGNPKIVKAGQTAELKATFKAEKLKGKVNKTVTVITNAPKQSSVVVRVSAAVN